MTVNIQLIRQDDIDIVWRLAQGPGLSATSSVPPNAPRSWVEDLVAQNGFPGPGWLTFVVVTDAEAVGIVTLKKIVIGDSAEVAYWIGTSHQGLGYAKAAGRAALAYAFETLDAKYVHAHYLRASNPASERVLTALGFAPDHSRNDFPTRAAGPDDRFYQAFPDDVWTFMRLDRAAWRSGAPA